MSKKSDTDEEKQERLRRVPRLRFPEFREEEGWIEKKLGELAIEVMEKGSELDRRVLTLSNEDGLVVQEEYFSKRIASIDTSRYTKIKRDDLVYNDRSTSKSPFGTIKRLSRYDDGLVSPIYLVFRLTPQVIPAYLNYYFDSGCHEREMSNIVDEGARFGRFNITPEKFFSIRILLPWKTEQQKIVDCLSSLDELIAAHNKKLDALKTYKKGLMQRLFPAEGETVPKLRFPEFRDAGDWEIHSLDELTVMISSGTNEKDSLGEYPLYGSTGVIGKCAVASYSGDYILVARVGASAGLITKARGKFGATDNTIVIRVNQTNSVNFVATSLSTLKIDRLRFGSGQPLITSSQLRKVKIPTPSLPEQNEVAQCLASLDKMVLNQERKVKQITKFKIGLLNQIFVKFEEVNDERKKNP